jgi:hypothetical protein
MYQNTGSYKCPFICTMTLYETNQNKKTFPICDFTSNDYDWPEKTVLNSAKL